MYSRASSAEPSQVEPRRAQDYPAFSAKRGFEESWQLVATSIRAGVYTELPGQVHYVAQLDDVT